MTIRVAQNTSIGHCKKRKVPL